MPGWSLGPKSPQAFPWGSLGSRGRESKDGHGSGVFVLDATEKIGCYRGLETFSNL